MKYYIVTSTGGHPELDLILAETLQEALRQYAVHWLASVDSDGSLYVVSNMRKDIKYSHDLEAIEFSEKIYDNEWTISKLDDDAFSTDIQCVYRGIPQAEKEKYVKLCRKSVGKTTRLFRKAFLWYLRSGVLVTFFRTRSYAMVFPNNLMQRYLVEPGDPPVVREWSGSYDDILQDMVV